MSGSHVRFAATAFARDSGEGGRGDVSAAVNHCVVSKGSARMGHAARRNPSTSHNQPFSWFQLAKIRLA